jgi:glycosyltransferase involved in cell wall biosynthesis
MKISVVTVTYNSAETIGATMKSVASQVHSPIEHILIDGASTDGTLAVVREHGPHVSTVVSEPDRGIYDAMNKGVGLATGDVIGFLNGDDYYAHDRVLSEIARAFSDGHVDAVFGDVGFFRADRPERLVRRYRSKRFGPKRLSWGWMPPHPALFVRTEVFRRVGAFRTDYRIAGDFEWIVRAFSGASIRYRHLPDIMVHMRTGGISTGGWRNTLQLNREVMRACRDNGLPTNWPKLLSKYPAKVLEFVLP